ncbi:hypothetical protein [Neptunicella sp. SCSIO 80796]|uniref:hypothetical protein n=1 Tax=Neptunicella plasticusilytica TaxID=3117012 RepID=UPI003A4E3A1D
MSDKIYYFPFQHVNRYVDLTKQTLDDLGYQVISYRKLYRLGNLFSRQHNIAVLNWFEDRPYRKSFSPFKQHIERVRTFFGILFMGLVSHKIIWVRHNYLPHNLGQSSRTGQHLAQTRRPLSHRINCFLLKHIASQIVSMEPTDLTTAVVPHPLYRSDSQLESASHAAPKETVIDYLFFGTIKPYKRLEELLEYWPAGMTLNILGFCAEQTYCTYLNGIIQRRQLRVNWQNEYVDEQELNHALAHTRYVIMPHEDDSMISSGTFYHAASYGTNFLCFPSKFAINKAQKHTFVHLIDKTRLEQDLAEINYIDPQQVISQSLDCYGQAAQKQAWQRLLQSSYSDEHSLRKQKIYD